MIGDFFSGVKSEQFEKWLRRLVGIDNRYKHLLLEDYEEERIDFYIYFQSKMSPWKALQEEYRKYG